MKKEWLLVLLGFFLFFVDRITKIIFREKFSIINPAVNTGTFFGLFKGHNLLFIIISLIVLILIIICFKKVNSNRRIALTFIISGILSNLIDRLLFGYVIDFIDFKFWPVFNFADVFIVIGVSLLIFKK